MRMTDFFFGGLFWGLLIIFFGLTLVIKTLFHIDLHLGRIFFAVVIILWGITLLTGRHPLKSPVIREDGEVTSVFSDRQMQGGPIERKYNVIFGREVIDLRRWDPEHDPLNIEVNVVFGSADVRLPENKTSSVKGTAVFGAAQFPDGQVAAFGERRYRTGGTDPGSALYVEANAVFGSLGVFK